MRTRSLDDGFGLLTLEARCFLSASLVNSGHPATFVDGDGTQIIVRLNGAGSGSVELSDNKLILTTSKTDRNTQITIAASGGDGLAVVRSIDAGTLGKVDAANVDLRGRITARRIGSISLHNIIKSTLRIDTLGSLSANAIGGSVISCDRLGNVMIATDVTDSRIVAVPADDSKVAIQSVTIAGSLNRSTIAAMGDIGSVTAAVMFSSNVTAGVRVSIYSSDTRLAQWLPDKRSGDDLYDFTGKYRIGQVSVTGKTAKQIAFAYSIIGAFEIDAVMLKKVDGRSPSFAGEEFGAAGHKVGSVQRSFDADHSDMNSVASPPTAFTVRQISEPLNFDPGTGSYGGVSSSGGTINVIGGSITAYLPHLIPDGGLKIGAVVNHKSRDLYLTPGDTYELRDAAGGAVLSAATLGAVLASLFRQSHTAVKIENLSPDDITFRTTSVSPAVTIASRFFGAMIWANDDTVSSVRIPAFSAVVADIHNQGIETSVYSKRLLLIDKQPLKLGTLIGLAGNSAVQINPSLQFTCQTSKSSKLQNAIISVSARPVSPRRLPARVEPGADGTFVIYGLPDGSTLSLTTMNNHALNAAGKITELPSSEALKQSFANSGLLVRN